MSLEQFRPDMIALNTSYKNYCKNAIEQLFENKQYDNLFQLNNQGQRIRDNNNNLLFIDNSIQQIFNNAINVVSNEKISKYHHHPRV